MNNNLNGMNGDGSKFFMTNDTPSVMGAKFDTWIVATSAAMEFTVIAGFEWGSGTLGTRRSWARIRPRHRRRRTSTRSIWR
jgi:hypothetical protein